MLLYLYARCEPLSWETRAKAWITVQSFVSLLPNRINSANTKRNTLYADCLERNSTNRPRLNSRFRFVLSGLTTEMYRPWSLALARYRFSSWPAVCLRTTYVVAISKSDILLFPPCSLASTIHLYIVQALPSLYFSLHFIYRVSFSLLIWSINRFDSICGVFVDQFVKRLTLEVSGT